jgi:hypothetical protein
MRHRYNKIGLKRKCSFFQKFREIFFVAFREKSLRKFLFSRKFSISRKFPFRMRIRIQEPLECVSRSEHWWILPKIFAKTILGTKNFRENENFRAKLSRNEISRKMSEFSLIFAFRENEKRGFRFNPI